MTISLKHFLPLFLVVFALLLSFSQASADEVPEGESQTQESSEPEKVDESGTPKKDKWEPIKKYFRYYAMRNKELSESDDKWWGHVTRLAPERMLKIDFTARIKRVDSRYQTDGSLGPWIEPIQLQDLFGDDALSIDADYESTGFYYTFEFSYGIYDWLNVFVHLPVQSTESWLKFDFEKDKAAQYGLRNEDDLFELFEKLGRPAPKLHHRSGGWEQGDLTVGVAWNYYRTPNVSLAVKPRILFPTGFRADPDAMLIYGLGPQTDVGKKSYALGLGHGLDLRPPGDAKLMVFSMQVLYEYYFQSERNAPGFKTPDNSAVNALLPYDSQGDFFPDLTDMDDTYLLAPQSNMEGEIFWGFDFKYVGLGIGYQVQWQQEAQIESNSDEFERMLKSMGTFSSAYRDRLLGRIFLPMYHLGFPCFWALEVGYSLSGINAFRPEDDYKGFVEFYIPF